MRQYDVEELDKGKLDWDGNRAEDLSVDEGPFICHRGFYR